eukprot:6213273-Pleurochrysis_carterae.AAC.4
MRAKQSQHLERRTSRTSLTLNKCAATKRVTHLPAAAPFLRTWSRCLPAERGLDARPLAALRSAAPRRAALCCEDNSAGLHELHISIDASHPLLSVPITKTGKCPY